MILFLILLPRTVISENNGGSQSVTTAVQRNQEGVIYKPYVTADEQFALDYGKLPLAKNKNANSLCSCIAHLYYKTGDLRIWGGFGTAGNIPWESKQPFAHGFVITTESSSGHIAEYIRTPQGEILVIDEANYDRCRRGSGRIIPPNVVKGFIELSS